MMPFDVPVKTKNIEVSYDYDRSNGENVLDIGLFDPLSMILPSTLLAFAVGRRATKQFCSFKRVGNARIYCWKLSTGNGR